MAPETMQRRYDEKLMVSMSNGDWYGGEVQGHLSLSCEYEGARYHIWIDSKTLAPLDDVLYKNSITDDRESPDYFETRHLRQDGASGREIVPQMLKMAPLLFKRHLKELKMNRVHEEAQSEDWQREKAIQNAARDLYDAARQALRVWPDQMRGSTLEAAVHKATWKEAR